METRTSSLGKILKLFPAFLATNPSRVSIKSGYLENSQGMFEIAFSRDSVEVTVPTPGSYDVVIHNARGQTVGSLNGQQFECGKNRLSMNVINASPGLYRILIDGIGSEFRMTAKMLLN